MFNRIADRARSAVSNHMYLPFLSLRIAQRRIVTKLP
jgi:hypothetical protein